MDVGIKKFDVKMDVKTKGIELDVTDSHGGHVGDLVVTKSKLIWCRGKIARENGKEITWAAFIEYIQAL